MKEELTREVIEALAKYSGSEYSKCENCPAAKICDSTDETACKWLATALLEEMDKPKVLDGAPEWATLAEVLFIGNGKSNWRYKCQYTREIPKTRARKNAEELYKILCFQRTGKTDCINAIESALEKYAEELKGGA